MADFEIVIDFAQNSRNPSRIFRSMAGLIESFSRFDQDFLDTIDLPITSEFILEDIEKSSLRALLKWILELPDKEALRDGDWKKVIGRIIDDGRTFLLQKLAEEPVVTERSQLEIIQSGLTEIASSAPSNLIHIPRAIPLPRLLTTIESFESSTRVLIEGDSAYYSYELKKHSISTNIVISPALRDELLEVIPVQQPTRIQLPIKKPDLMGDSQWDLYMSGHVIHAKILDYEWLRKFRDLSVVLKPGDSLDALIEITALQSQDGQIVGNRYHILQVYGVTHRLIETQLNLPSNSEMD